MPTYQQLFRDAERQQAMADQLQQRSVQSRAPQQQGGLASPMHWGAGLAQIGEALIAHKLGKKAAAKTTEAEEAKRKMVADAIKGLSTQGGDPYAAANAAIESGVDPNVVAKVFADQQRQEQMTTEGKRRSDDVALEDRRTLEERTYRSGEAELNRAFKRELAGDKGNQIGQYNPRDYTTDSWTKFVKSGDPGALKRFKGITTVDLGGGRQGIINSASGAFLGETIPKDDFNQNTEEVKQAASQGAAQGKAITAAKEQLGAVDVTAAQLETLMADKNFGQSVGPLDAVTGRIGEMFGSEQGVLGGQVQRLANQLVADAVKSWKGAISERELQFFQDSVPGRGSSAETWKHWYENEFKPRQALAKNIASGAVFGAADGGSESAPAKTTSSGVTWTVEP